MSRERKGSAAKPSSARSPLCVFLSDSFLPLSLAAYLNLPTYLRTHPPSISSVTPRTTTLTSQFSQVYVYGEYVCGSPCGERKILHVTMRGRVYKEKKERERVVLIDGRVTDICEVGSRFEWFVRFQGVIS